MLWLLCQAGRYGCVAPSANGRVWTGHLGKRRHVKKAGARPAGSSLSLVSMFFRGLRLHTACAALRQALGRGVHCAWRLFFLQVLILHCAESPLLRAAVLL
jgi:hypothetical protein